MTDRYVKRGRTWRRPHATPGHLEASWRDVAEIVAAAVATAALLWVIAVWWLL